MRDEEGEGEHLDLVAKCGDEGKARFGVQSERGYFLDF